MLFLEMGVEQILSSDNYQYFYDIFKAIINNFLRNKKGTLLHITILVSIKQCYIWYLILIVNLLKKLWRAGRIVQSLDEELETGGSNWQKERAMSNNENPAWNKQSLGKWHQIIVKILTNSKTVFAASGLCSATDHINSRKQETLKRKMPSLKTTYEMKNHYILHRKQKAFLRGLAIWQAKAY